MIIPKYWQDGVCDDETEVEKKFLPSIFLHLVLDQLSQSCFQDFVTFCLILLPIAATVQVS